jgi:hypothetical protein
MFNSHENIVIGVQVRSSLLHVKRGRVGRRGDNPFLTKHIRPDVHEQEHTDNVSTQADQIYELNFFTAACPLSFIPLSFVIPTRWDAQPSKVPGNVIIHNQRIHHGDSGRHSITTIDTWLK